LVQVGYYGTSQKQMFLYLRMLGKPAVFNV
jgi:hypothetical protein